jgi:hypothetical protein
MTNRMTVGIVRAALALALTTLAIAAIAFPAGASAALRPTLTVTPGAGSTAGATGSLQLAIAFGQTAGDAATNVAIGLPPGLLINQQIGAGACLKATAPAAQCQIGSGVATIAGVPTNVALYLVKPPAAGALAGVALVGGPLSVVGQLRFRAPTQLGLLPSASLGTEISFADLPASPVSALDLTLTGLRLPSSCTPVDVDLWASSQQDPSSVHVSGPYSIGGCTTLAYAPMVAEHATRVRGRTGTWSVTMTVPAADSTTEGLTLKLPPALTLNPKLKPCLDGTTCTVGTVTATSPEFAPGLFKGTISLSGTPRDPTLGVAMPSPADLTIATTATVTELQLTSMPDIPFAQLRLKFTGNSLGSMFVVQCYASPFKAIAQSTSGKASTSISGNLKESGCRNKPQRRPQASVSLTGLAHAAPLLSLSAVSGVHAPKLKKLSIGLPKGLSFTTAGPGPDARTVGRALGLSNGRVVRATVHSQYLSVTLMHSVRRTSLSLQKPLLVESRELAAAIRAGKSRTQWLTVGMTDYDGRFTKVTIPVAVGPRKHGA